MSSEYLTVNEAAAEMNTHPETIRRWIRDQKLNAIRVKGSSGYRIEVDELERFKAILSTPNNGVVVNISQDLLGIGPVKVLPELNLSIGQRLTRAELVETFHNGFMGGIRFKRNYENAMVITSIGNKREDSPYEDVWSNGFLYYTGEGLEGDQDPNKKGNRMLFEQQIQKFPLHVVQYFGPDEYYYAGLFQVLDVATAMQPDKHGRPRRVFIFQMGPMYENVMPTATMDGLQNQSFLLNHLQGIQHDLEKQDSQLEKYKRSRQLVNGLKQLYEYNCQLCNPDNPIPNIEMKNGRNYVEVHHIEGFAEVVKKLGESQDDGQYVVDSLRNTIVVCVHHHKLLHHYKSPIGFDRRRGVFVAEDSSLELPIHRLVPGHNIVRTN